MSPNLQRTSRAVNAPLPLLHVCAFSNVQQSYAQAASFIGALTQQSPETATLDFRLIHDVDKTIPAHHFRATLPQVWDTILQYQASGYGAYVNINALDGNGRELSNVQCIRAHIVDLDNLSAEANYLIGSNWNPAPSFAVCTSPSKYHLYWIVQNYFGNERYTTLQRKLRQTLDGDRAVIDPTRVARLPGTLHLKNPMQPHLVTCWSLGNVSQPIPVEALEQSVAHVNVIDGAGGRHPLGEPSMAAPSLDWLRFGMSLIDPNELDRTAWLSVSAAIKQAGWLHADEQTLLAMWSEWCSRYTGNNDAENEKLWRSVKDTEIGWKSLYRHAPTLQAYEKFGFKSEVPKPPEFIPNPANIPEYLDGIEPETIASTNAAAMRKMHELRIPLAYDEFAKSVMLTEAVPWDTTRDYPRQWTDNDGTGCKTLLEAHFLKPSKDTVADVAVFIAKRNKFHPIKAYLCSLMWDGNPRLDKLFTDYFGSPRSDYHSAVGKRFMIGAVARIMRPGCKLDTMLILEGAQGVGKSSALKALCGELWFGDHLPEIGRDKDTMLYLAGKWIVEIAELSAFNKAESNRIKSFASSAIDNFRAPYARNNESHPRQCVFAGTTNDEGYLPDQTGNRRYWPVAVNSVNIEALQRDRDQLWAEARCRFDLGEHWWLSDAEEKMAAEEQEDRRAVDAWQDRITAFVVALNGAPVSADHIARAALDLSIADLNGTTSKRIAGCLRVAGYKRKKLNENGNRVWKYGPINS